MITQDISISNCFKVHIPFFRSGCDLNSPRREGAGGRGGEEAHDLAAPLHLCCTWGLEAVVQVLLEHGANINAQVRQ